jgi:hypothetical protein
VLALSLTFLAALIRWGDVVVTIWIVASAAIYGALFGFWLAAEWTNVDDRTMVGDPLPYLAIAACTVLGAVVCGGAALLGTMLWG